MLHNPGIVEDAANRLRSADAMVIPHGPVSELPYLDLWQDDWLAVVADDNDEVGESLTMQNLADLPWVLTFQSRSAFTSAARQIQQLGVEPHIEVVLESFLSVGHFVSGTRRVGLVQSALAPHLLRIASAASAWCPCRSRRRRSSAPCGGTPRTIAIPSTSGCAASSPRPVA